jgi:hypothetical protein
MKYLTIVFLSVIMSGSFELHGQELKPDSARIKGRTYEIIDASLIHSHKAMGGNIYVGYGFYNGNMSDYISNQILVGINVDLHRHRRIVQFDVSLGFGKTLQDMEFPEQLEWEKNKLALSAILGCNLGYSIVDNRNFLIAPLAGIGINSLSSSFLTVSDNIKNEPILPYYKIGFFIDIKPLAILQDHVRINNKDENYTSMRISMGINSSIGKPKYSDYYLGRMLYITVGMGGLSRNYEKKAPHKHGMPRSP